MPRGISPEKRRENRLLIFNKYNGRCAYCGCKLSDVFQVDHFIPKRRYKNPEYHSVLKERGNDSFENSMPCCSTCNCSKSDLDIEQFRDRIADRVLRLNQYSSEYSVAKKFGLVVEIDKEIVFYFEKLDMNG